MVIKQIKVNGVAIFSKISLIMLNKISSILSILSFLISLTTIGAGWTAYKWVTSPNFEALMLEKVMKEVSKILPNQIDKKMPKVTGPMVEMSDDTKQFWDYIEKRNRKHIEWETKGKWEQ